jgi:hypothetical protein
MKFGINFFPTVAPSEKSGATFYDECLELCERVEELGYHHGRLDVGFAGQLEVIRGHYGDIEPSLLVSFGNMPVAESVRTVELFARHVMPRFGASSRHEERC